MLFSYFLYFEGILNALNFISVTWEGQLTLAVIGAGKFWGKKYSERICIKFAG